MGKGYEVTEFPVDDILELALHEVVAAIGEGAGHVGKGYDGNECNCFQLHFL